MTPEEIRQKIWQCLKKTLERNNLPWAREDLQSCPIKIPICIVTSYTDDVVMHIDTDLLSNNSIITWKVLEEIEKALKAKFGNVKCSQFKNFKFFEFKVS